MLPVKLNVSAKIANAKIESMDECVIRADTNDASPLSTVESEKRWTTRTTKNIYLHDARWDCRKAAKAPKR